MKPFTLIILSYYVTVSLIFPIFILFIKINAIDALLNYRYLQIQVPKTRFLHAVKI